MTMEKWEEMTMEMRWHTRTVTSTAILALAMAGVVVTSAKADDNLRSSPPDTTSYSRPLVPEDLILGNTAGTAGLAGRVSFSVVDTVVDNTNPNLRFTDLFNDGETSIAINPRHPNEIVITAFSGSWGAAAPLWLSRNGGGTWTKEFSINPPIGVTGVPGCPCDQTVDFGSFFNRLAGTFLTALPINPTTTFTNIYSATTRNPTTPAFQYFPPPPAATQRTNDLHGVNAVDQPWLLVGPKPGVRGENAYVAYDDFSTAPDMRVAVATATDRLNFTIDNRSGLSDGFVNPGHRLAIDPVTGAVYSLFQRRISAGAGGSQNINYMLNRSIDGGLAWTLNGSATGIIVANADSTQPTPKFCTVNALLGGVDHAAVDPQTGDVVYVFGTRDVTTGINQLAMKRLINNGTGLTIPLTSIQITKGLVNAAIPSVAITDNGTIGVFYYTCDRVPPSPAFPILTAHFAISTNQGASFDMGIELETFLSPALDDVTDPPNIRDRQRVLGDYMQVKAVGNTFFGSFTGNGAPFGRTISNNDPIFYKVSVR
jgi:hypothetical protein